MENLSLPSRERGLKFMTLKRAFVDIESLPSRERGLKSQTPVQKTDP